MRPIPESDWQLRRELEAELSYAKTPEEQGVYEGLLAMWDLIHFLRNEPIEDDHESAGRNLQAEP